MVLQPPQRARDQHGHDDDADDAGAVDDQRLGGTQAGGQQAEEEGQQDYQIGGVGRRGELEENQVEADGQRVAERLRDLLDEAKDRTIVTRLPWET